MLCERNVGASCPPTPTQAGSVCTCDDHALRQVLQLLKLFIGLICFSRNTIAYGNLVCTDCTDLFVNSIAVVVAQTPQLHLVTCIRPLPFASHAQ